MDETLFKKMCLIASKEVGKKTFVRNYVNSFYGDTMMTIGAAFGIKVVEMYGIKINLNFWVNSDKENRFKYLYRRYIDDSNGVILMYDITNAETLNKLSEWYLLIKENLDHDPPILLVGNKLDLEEHREVSKEQVEKFKEKHKLTSSMEISLKTGENVEEMFVNIIKMILASQF
jgi:small GTP-binding protein